VKRLIADTLVIAERNLVRLPRSPDLLLAFTVQPIMFVLLFVYVFGGAISTPGYTYTDFLIPGIIVQNIAFGGFVTAIGLNEDLHKGLIDRFRSLPMARPAVLAGRTSADIVTNLLSAIILVVTGLIIGFSFGTGIGEILAGFLLLIFFLVATKFAEEERELNVLLPDASEAQPRTSKPRETIVNIDEAGRYFVSGRQLSLDELEKALRIVRVNNPGRASVIFRADRRCQVDFLVAAMNACNKARIRDYRITTSESS